VGELLPGSTTINPIGEFLDAFERLSIGKIYCLNENLFTNEKCQEKRIPRGQNDSIRRALKEETYSIDVLNFVLCYRKTHVSREACCQYYMWSEPDDLSKVIPATSEDNRALCAHGQSLRQ
jgi:hypothetical protein